MEKFKILIIVLIILFLSSFSLAQVSVNIGLGTPPLWGPVGYSNIQYYYLPGVDAYYNLETEMFIYFSNGYWISSYYLPYRYRNYDLYRGYKVPLHYRGHRPYDNYSKHRQEYKSYKNHKRHNQRTIGVCPHNGYQVHQYQRSRQQYHQKQSPINKQQNRNVAPSRQQHKRSVAPSRQQHNRNVAPSRQQHNKKNVAPNNKGNNK